MPMANYRLDCLVVIGVVSVDWGLLAIIEIIADPVAREDLRRNHPRTNVAAPVAQHKAVKAAFLRGPVFARRDHYGPPGSSSGPAKKEGVDASTIENRGFRQLPRTFFDHDAGDSASGKEQGEKRSGEKFGAHGRWVSENRNDCERGCIVFETAPPAFN
jgi:hypothetical protein